MTERQSKNEKMFLAGMAIGILGGYLGNFSVSALFVLKEKYFPGASPSFEIITFVLSTLGIYGIALRFLKLLKEGKPLK